MYLQLKDQVQAENSSQQVQKIFPVVCEGDNGQA